MMDYHKRLDKAVKKLKIFEHRGIEVIAMQADEIRKALRIAHWSEEYITKYLKQNGYIPGKEEE